MQAVYINHWTRMKRKSKIRGINAKMHFQTGEYCHYCIIYYLKNHIEGTSGLFLVDLKEEMLLLETFYTIALSGILQLYLWFSDHIHWLLLIAPTHCQGFIQRVLTSCLLGSQRHWNSWTFSLRVRCIWVTLWLFPLVSTAMAKTENMTWEGVRQAWEIQDR